MFKSEADLNRKKPYLVAGKQIQISKAEIALNPYKYIKDLKHLFTEAAIKMYSVKPAKNAIPVDMEKAKRGKVFSEAFKKASLKKQKADIAKFKKAVEAAANKK